MLDRLEAFARGKLDAGGGDVVLRVDELLGRAHRGFDVRHLVERHRLAFAQLGDLGQRGRLGLEAGALRGRGTRGGTVGQGVRKRALAMHAAHRGHAGHLAGHEAEDVVAPLGARAGVRREMHDRAVAAGGGDGVAGERLDTARDAEAADVDAGDQRTADTLLALRLDHRGAGDDADVARTRLIDEVALGMLARIDDRDHLAAGIDPVERGAVGVVVRGR